jgi:ABC-type transport system involved in cytochrome c biogenesis permease subunit
LSRAANQLRENLRALSPSIYPRDQQLRLEYFYNHFEAFYRAIWCYGIAFVILIAAHLRKRGRALQSIGVAVAVLGLAFHAAGIVIRCIIASRPPVTNMYESIIWVSFAVSFFGMIFFMRYRAPICLLAALPVTLTALLLVHQMPIAMPSSIDPLVPVLRDNFWLTVHVLTITLSYAAFALAMGFGHILLWRYARNSYGFGIGGETYVAIFVALDLLFVAFAIWRYRRSTTASVVLSEIEPERASAQL